MSSTPKQPIAGTPAGKLSTALTALQQAGGYIGLAAQLAGIGIPLVKGLITKIEGIGTGNVTITFTEMVAADEAELQAVIDLADGDVQAVNAELARMGLPQLPVTAAGPAADPAPGTSNG